MKKPNFKAVFSRWKRSFTTRSFRVGGYSVMATAIVLALAVAANILVGALPAKITQFDTSSNQLFTISQQTTQIVSGLSSDVTIYWIVQDGQEDSTLETLLSRYASLSDKLRVQKKDPDVFPTFAQQYTSETVNNNSLVVTCGERYRYVDYNDIYEVDYSNYYTTGSYDVSFGGENALTSAIGYVVSEDLPKLYVLTGHGELELTSSFQSAVEQENIETESLSLLTMEAVPEDADAVAIFAPESDISQEEADMLRTYLKGGGNLLYISQPPQNGALTNLESLLGEYGVTAAQGVVVESNQQNYLWDAPYYLLPDIKSHTITSPLLENGYYVLLPVAQGLVVSDDLPEGITAIKLLTTSDSAFSKVAGYGMTAYQREDGDIDGPFALAVSMMDSSCNAHIVWVSSSALLDESTNSRVSGGNQDFFLNALGWMCGQENSISIHAKSMGYKYLTMDSSTSSMLTILMIGVLPVAYLGAGIYTWVRRKRR